MELEYHFKCSSVAHKHSEGEHIVFLFHFEITSSKNLSIILYNFKVSDEICTLFYINYIHQILTYSNLQKDEGLKGYLWIWMHLYGIRSILGSILSILKRYFRKAWSTLNIRINFVCTAKFQWWRNIRTYFIFHYILIHPNLQND